MERINYNVSVPGYTIRLGQKSEFAEIYEFVSEYFSKEETVFLNFCANTTVTEEEEKWMEEDEVKLLKAIYESSPTIVITHEVTGKIAGVLMTIYSRDLKSTDSFLTLFNQNPPKSPLLKQYFNYFADLLFEARLCERFPSAKAALEFYAIAVDPDHRNKGIGRELVGACLALVKTLPDVGFIFAICTSPFSKKIAERIGMQSILDTDLLTYRNASDGSSSRNTSSCNKISVVVSDLK